VGGAGAARMEFSSPPWHAEKLGGVFRVAVIDPTTTKRGSGNDLQSEGSTVDLQEETRSLELISNCSSITET
jgi:hypothetical protein